MRSRCLKPGRNPTFGLLGIFPFLIAGDTTQLPTAPRISTGDGHGQEWRQIARETKNDFPSAASTAPEVSMLTSQRERRAGGGRRRRCTGGWSGDRCQLCNGAEPKPDPAEECAGITTFECHGNDRVQHACPKKCFMCYPPTTGNSTAETRTETTSTTTLVTRTQAPWSRFNKKWAELLRNGTSTPATFAPSRPNPHSIITIAPPQESTADWSTTTTTTMTTTSGTMSVAPQLSSVPTVVATCVAAAVGFLLSYLVVGMLHASKRRRLLLTSGRNEEAVFNDEDGVSPLWIQPPNHGPVLVPDRNHFRVHGNYYHETKEERRTSDPSPARPIQLQLLREEDLTRMLRDIGGDGGAAATDTSHATSFPIYPPQYAHEVAAGAASATCAHATAATDLDAIAAATKATGVDPTLVDLFRISASFSRQQLELPAFPVTVGASATEAKLLLSLQQPNSATLDNCPPPPPPPPTGSTLTPSNSLEQLELVGHRPSPRSCVLTMKPSPDIGHMQQGVDTFTAVVQNEAVESQRLTTGDGKWQSWVLELTMKERTKLAEKHAIAGEELRLLKLATRRYKRARAQRQYHKRQAVAAGKSHSKQGSPKGDGPAPID